MRLHHIAFGAALICAGFAWAAPMAWDRHLAVAAFAWAWLIVGLVLVTGSKALDIFHPARNDRYNRRALDKAFNEGRSLGAVDGPSERTLARWRREGFNVPGARHD
jgi:hypothetical protein